MFDSILKSLFGNRAETKRAVSDSVLNRIKKRKLIVQKFKNINPNNNLKRAKTAKELLNVSGTKGERKAAREFYKDETKLNNLKDKIELLESVNEKLSLARQGKRLAAKKQKKFWENLINELQKLKQNKNKPVKKITEKENCDNMNKKENETEKENIDTKESEIDGSKEIYENEKDKDDDFNDASGNQSDNNQNPT